MTEEKKSYPKREKIVLNDESMMPFGAWKDKTMINVPAKYLFWLRDDHFKKMQDKGKRIIGHGRAVIDYVNDNEDVLKLELEKP